MAVSLEVRAPLLDHRVVELALTMPMGLKHHGRTTKWALRQLLYKRVPRALIDRPKMGFGVPLGDWFRGPLREQMADYCAGSDLERLGVDPAPVRRLWAQFERRETHRSELLWQMFMLVAWSRRYLTARSPVAVPGLAC
jgi:asparagine synthase (glutamine-hydrolysing)